MNLEMIFKTELIILRKSNINKINKIKNIHLMHYIKSFLKSKN